KARAAPQAQERGQICAGGGNEAWAITCDVLIRAWQTARARARHYAMFSTLRKRWSLATDARRSCVELKTLRGSHIAGAQTFTEFHSPEANMPSSSQTLESYLPGRWLRGEGDPGRESGEGHRRHGLRLYHQR